MGISDALDARNRVRRAARVVCVLLGCLALVGCSGASLKKSDGTYTVETEYDEFSGVKKTFVEIPLQTGGMYHFKRQIWLKHLESNELNEASQAAGIDPTRNIGFTYFRQGKGWAYLDCHHVYLLADGERLRPDTEHDGSILYESVGEYIYFDVPRAYVKRMATADRAAIKICNDADELSPEVKRTFGNFLDSLPTREECLSIQDDYEQCLQRGGYDPTKSE